MLPDLLVFRCDMVLFALSSCVGHTAVKSGGVGPERWVCPACLRETGMSLYGRHGGCWVIVRVRKNRSLSPPTRTSVTPYGAGTERRLLAQRVGAAGLRRGHGIKVIPPIHDRQGALYTALARKKGFPAHLRGQR